MYRIILPGVCAIFFLGAVWAADPRVENVQARQIEGTRKVEITYDVFDDDGDTLQIWVQISKDGGQTFDVPALTFAGDVGQNIQPGTGKRIEWDAGADMPGAKGDQYQARVVAFDGTASDNRFETPGPFEHEMVLVPGGPFIMGTDAGEQDEVPTRSIFLDAFLIDKYEVTNAQFAVFLTANGGETDATGNRLSSSSDIVLTGQTYGVREGRNPKAPMADVAWYGADAYCHWAGLRLPTEAEWEKVARGVDARIYPWGKEFRINHANISGTSKDSSSAKASVGSYPAGVSPYGVQDMAGNVWEWVADWYAEGGLLAASARNPSGPETGNNRVRRGGGWRDSESAARTTNRGYSPPGTTLDSVGFRCARDHQE